MSRKDLRPRLNRRSATLLLAGALVAGPDAAAAAKVDKAASSPAADTDGPSTLPGAITWQTNNDDPLIGSTDAIRGGTLNMAIYSYPLTFRLMGPNANDSFASWNYAFTMAFTLVTMHPVTGNFIPIMATEWSVQPDRKTLYFKLDPDARFSDGKSITADDYVFTWKMMLSKYIVDPYYNTYAKEYFKSVDRIDDYTLRIVGTKPSWRPLYDYGGLWPTPAHATKLDSDWVTRTNNQPPIAIGPYVISDFNAGESVTFKRTPHWWGDKKRYFLGQYNFDEIKLQVISPERELDYLRRGQIDLMSEGSARSWHENYGFDAVINGWLRRARIFVDMPVGLNGMQMNLEDPILTNQDFRLAMQYLFDFERLNRNLMYGEYFRINSFFQGTKYANPDVKAYPFDPVKAQAHLRRAGYRRPPATRRQGFWASLRTAAYDLVFTRSEADDVLVNDRGEKASFTVIYGSAAFGSLLTVMQQDYRRAGVDMRLQLLEPGAMFERMLERKFEMGVIAMTSGIYPTPRQYLDTIYKNSTNNNDFWGFGTKQVDGLIRIYERSLDADARRKALWKIDKIVHDDAFYVPFWYAPYIRVAYWDYVQFPKFYLPKRTQLLTDYFVEWIDPQKKQALAEAMRDDKPYPVDADIDKDYYDVRKKFN